MFDAKMTEFSHSPLLLSNSTRLLSVLSHDAAFSLKCRILEHDLDNLPISGYTALSYCWGTQLRASSIILNDKSYRITKNLHAAMDVLNRSYANSLFWIDAICIDQSNLRERSSQVLRMRTIYEKASRVVIWLGAGSIKTAKAMSWIKQIDSFWNSLSSIYGSDRSILFDICVQRITEIFDVQSGIIEFAPLRGLVDLFTHPWFSRVWIVQETTTPREDMYVHCGNAIVRWNSLITTMRIITHLLRRPELRDFFDHAPSIQNEGSRRLFNIDKQREYGRPVLQFIQVLAKYRLFQATDQRDKIYALRGLAADLTNNDIYPNYSLSLDTVFAQTAEFLIISKKSFECLGFCDYSKRKSLPTWVPDWGSQMMRHPLAKRSVHDGYQDQNPALYKAATIPKSACNSKQKWTCTITDGLILTARGFYIDVIERRAGFEVSDVSSTMPSHPWYENNITDDSRTAALYGIQIPDSRMYRSSSEPLAMAYSRTIVADVEKSGNKRTRGYSINLDHWRHVRHYTQAAAENKYRKEWGSLLFSIMGRCMFLSTEGYLGLGPVDMQPGDRICAFFGGDVLYILRQVEDFYHFIGECYVHGLMDGEALSLLNGTSHKTEDFVIV